MRRPKTMKCPVCGSLNHRVVDSSGGPNETYKRHRQCVICGVTFNTFEMTEDRYRQLLKAESELKQVTSIVRSHL